MAKNGEFPNEGFVVEREDGTIELHPIHWGHFGYVKSDGRVVVVVDDEGGGKVLLAENRLRWNEIYWAKKRKVREKVKVLIECLGGNRCKILRVAAPVRGKLKLLGPKGAKGVKSGVLN